MLRQRQHQSWLFITIMMLPCIPLAAAAEEYVLERNLSETDEALRERNLPRARDVAEAWQLNYLQPRTTTRRLRLDVQPLLRNIVEALNGMGIPLRQLHDPRGLRILGIAASFSVGAAYPAVNFHLADRCPDTLNVFNRGGRGLSWAFQWPANQFTLRIEGGDDSEFGSYAIAGAQWNHPRLPLAFGVGLPVRMKHADGLLGAIFQVRAKLN